MVMREFLGQVYFGNTVHAYIMSIFIFIISFLIIKIIEKIILTKLKVWSEKTETSGDDFIISVLSLIVVPVAYLASFYLAAKSLVLPAHVEKVISVGVMGIIVISVARFISHLFAYLFQVYFRKKNQKSVDEASLSGIIRIVTFLIWALAIIFYLDNLGFKISSVIAGLGIGGIAVALAAQTVLGDLFSYFAILFDRPFEIGDFIITGDFMGVVEKIGIKTTRIKSLSGEQIVFSNSDLTNSRVRNYKRMLQRRVLFKLGVTYGTPLEQLKMIPKIIENIVKSVEGTVFDRAHFSAYGDFNLQIEVVYYVQSGDYNKYMDINQEINFSIKEEFEARKIEFAFPTQTVYINKQ